MSDPEMTPSRTADDAGGKSDDVTLPADTQIEDETVAIDTASGGTQSPGDDDE